MTPLPRSMHPPFGAALTAWLLLTLAFGAAAEDPAAGASVLREPGDLSTLAPSVGLAQLEYLTEEWAPFNFAQKGVATGISVEVLEAAFRNIGVNRSRADVRIVPLAEGYPGETDPQGRRRHLASLSPERGVFLGSVGRPRVQARY